MESLLQCTRRPDITFRRNGKIDISSHAAKMLGLERGDVIDVLKDRGEYYLYIRLRNPAGNHNARAFPTYGRGQHFRSWCQRLCTAMMQICGVDTDARLTVGEPLHDEAHGTLLPIITRCML